MAEEENEEGTAREAVSTPVSPSTFDQPDFLMKVRLLLDGGHTRVMAVPNMSFEDFARAIFVDPFAEDSLLDSLCMLGVRRSSVVGLEILDDSSMQWTRKRDSQDEQTDTR